MSPPTPSQIRRAAAVQIPSESTPCHARADDVFQRLPIRGYKRAAKREFFRRVFAAAHEAIRTDSVIWAQLSDKITSKADRRVLDALVETGRFVVYRHRKDRCSRFWITPLFHAELAAVPFPWSRRRATVRLRGRATKRKAPDGRTRKIPGLPVSFDAEHPTAADTREKLWLVNDCNQNYRFWSKHWDCYIDDFNGFVVDHDPRLRALFSSTILSKAAGCTHSGRPDTSRCGGSSGVRSALAIPRRSSWTFGVSLPKCPTTRWVYRAAVTPTTFWATTPQHETPPRRFSTG